MADYEKLGAFYLGKLYDLDEQQITDELLLYDSKDLTTHAVCVGMTGSGKTGLCLALLEEAAIDGIPSLIIDPKGDLGNLMLTFPGLQAKDFRPWVDPGEAGRMGLTPEAYAADRAKLWRRGLADWDQDGSRIERLRQAAEVAIYTPGSDAGLPLRVLRSLQAPPPAIVADADALRERLSATISGLLGLVGVEADPIQSREHILLSNLVDRHWRRGRDLDIAALIAGIQTPPFDKLGIMDLESFFPANERFKLAMALNNLLASPSFAAWMEGQPLDIGQLLYTPEGRPRIAILSIAHLDDAQRMFFVTLLLNEVLSWMRSQPGTGTLRALLYMDEIFGFFPPTANPPSKKPMLTLLKQARAFGLGVVLSTQNPVDLDYKGLTNAGTWFIGRLQTQRDKDRLLDGLEGAAAHHLDRAALDRLLSSLDSRVFLMNNVHEDAPVLFHTRWVLSYLRGPLTRTQIQTLMAPRKAATPVALAAPITDQTDDGEPSSTAPPLPPGVEQRFLPAEDVIRSTDQLRYEPALVGVARLHFVRRGAKIDDWQTVAVLAAAPEVEDDVSWPDAEIVAGAPDLERRADDGGVFADLPAAAARASNYKGWAKDLAGHLYRDQSRSLWRCAELKTYSRLGESQADFRVRLRHQLHEKRDHHIEKLRKRYAPKLARLEERIRKGEARVERKQSQVKQLGLQTAVSFGTTILGAIFGRKKMGVGTVSRAGTALGRAGRTARERGDVSRARENVEALRKQYEDLAAEFDDEIDEIRDGAGVEDLELEEIVIRPRKSDIAVERLALAWTPHRVGADGASEPLFEWRPRGDGQ